MNSTQDNEEIQRIKEFCRLTQDPSPIHFDESLAKKYGLESLAKPGLYVISQEMTSTDYNHLRVRFSKFAPINEEQDAIKVPFKGGLKTTIKSKKDNKTLLEILLEKEPHRHELHESQSYKDYPFKLAKEYLDEFERITRKKNEKLAVASLVIRSLYSWVNPELRTSRDLICFSRGFTFDFHQDAQPDSNLIIRTIFIKKKKLPTQYGEFYKYDGELRIFNADNNGTYVTGSTEVLSNKEVF